VSMSLSSSLNAGVAGLSVNATRLAVISDNIANSSTNGYRRADVEFSSLMIPSGPNSFSAGGVTATTFRDVAKAGALIGTGNSTDISVSGRGMLPVTTTTSVRHSSISTPGPKLAKIARPGHECLR
jgi:flagellar hook protein FlgE